MAASCSCGRIIAATGPQYYIHSIVAHSDTQKQLASLGVQRPADYSGVSIRETHPGIAGQSLPRYEVVSGPRAIELRASPVADGGGWTAWERRGDGAYKPLTVAQGAHDVENLAVAVFGLFDEDLHQQPSGGPDIEGLTDAFVDARARFRVAGLDRIRAVLDGGTALVAIRDAVGGHFLDYLAAHGMAARTAQRWMQLARSGWSAEEVLQAGGIKAAAKQLAQPAAAATEPPPALPGFADTEDLQVGDGCATVAHEPGEDHDDAYCAPGPQVSAPPAARTPAPVDDALLQREMSSRSCAGQNCRDTPRRNSHYCRPCQRRAALGDPHVLASSHANDGLYADVMAAWQDVHRLERRVKTLESILQHVRVESADRGGEVDEQRWRDGQ